jgi:carboxypeptidase Q
LTGLSLTQRYYKMKSLLPISLILLLFTTFLAFTFFQKAEDPTRVFKAMEAEEVPNTHVSDALKDATTRIGHRLTGSENGHKAEQYAFDLFRSYGFKDVSFHEFEVDAWSRENVSLKLYYGNNDTASTPIPGNTFPAKINPENAGCVTLPEVVSLAHSPVKADVFASVIDVGNGLKKDFEALKDSVKGKIVLLNLSIYPKDSTQKNLHRSEKTALAIRYGAAGCIFINNVEGRILLTGTASVNGKLISIPAVCITQEDGQSLRQCMGLSHGMRARIRMNNRSGKIKARNVVATLPGTSLPEEEIILCGHLDSWDLATGAIDNGIGSFTVMEIARMFEKLNIKTRRTIKFVTFMGEEQGLLGSRAMIEEMTKKGTLNKLRYVINLDMAGNTDGFNLSGRPEMEPFVRKVIAQIKSVDSTFKGTVTNRAGLHSDHQPFLEQGVPILDPEGSLDKSVYKFYHSNKDNFNLVNPEHMKRCALYTGMMLYALAEEPELVAHKLNDTETRDFLLKANLKEELMIEEQWRWK